MERIMQHLVLLGPHTQGVVSLLVRFDLGQITCLSGLTSTENQRRDKWFETTDKILGDLSSLLDLQ